MRRISPRKRLTATSEPIQPRPASAHHEGQHGRRGAEDGERQNKAMAGARSVKTLLQAWPTVEPEAGAHARDNRDQDRS